MITASLMKSLSYVQQRILLHHIGVESLSVNVFNRQTIKTLMARKLIRPAKPGPFRFPPAATVLTIKGREIAARLLAEYADALATAGYLEREIQPEQSPLERLKSMKKSGNGTAIPGPILPEPTENIEKSVD